MEEARSWLKRLDSNYAQDVPIGGGRIGTRGGDEGKSGEEGRSSPKRKLLLGVANVGGSITVLLQIALVAWGIRRLRSMLATRRERIEGNAEKNSETAPSSRAVDQVPFAMLSPVAVKKIVDLDSVGWMFVDVRDETAVNENSAPFEGVLHIPEPELNASLQLSEEEWEARFPSTKRIGQGDFIVFLSTKGDRAQKAAAAVSKLGYLGCCVLAGGIEAYEAAMRDYVDKPLKFLSRDAVATLLEDEVESGAASESRSITMCLLDVRRRDERAAFGHIKGSQNIPVLELPKALCLDEERWEESYHFPKFGKDDTIVFQCRLNAQACWAAQVAQDAGLERCFVYKDGVIGWRLDPDVHPHDSYKPGDTPPDPIPFEVEQVDHDAAKEELLQMGLI